MIQYAIWMASGSTSWVLQLFSHEPLGTSNTLRLATHRRSLAAVDRPYPTRPSSWSTFIGSDAERDAVSFNVSLCSRFLNIFFPLRSSSCRLPFALQVPVMLLSYCQSFNVIALEVAFDSRAPDRLTALCSFEDCHCSTCISKRPSLCKNHWSSWHMIINWCFMRFPWVKKQNSPCRSLSLTQSANGFCVPSALHFRIFWGSTAQSAFV